MPPRATSSTPSSSPTPLTVSGASLHLQLGEADADGMVQFKISGKIKNNSELANLIKFFGGPAQSSTDINTFLNVVKNLKIGTDYAQMRSTVEELEVQQTATNFLLHQQVTQGQLLEKKMVDNDSMIRDLQLQIQQLRVGQFTLSPPSITTSHFRQPSFDFPQANDPDIFSDNFEMNTETSEQTSILPANADYTSQQIQPRSHSAQDFYAHTNPLQLHLPASVRGHRSISGSNPEQLPSKQIQLHQQQLIQQQQLFQQNFQRHQSQPVSSAGVQPLAQNPRSEQQNLLSAFPGGTFARPRSSGETKRDDTNSHASLPPLAAPNRSPFG